MFFLVFELNEEIFWEECMFLVLGWFVFCLGILFDVMLKVNYLLCLDGVGEVSV